MISVMLSTEGQSVNKSMSYMSYDILEYIFTYCMYDALTLLLYIVLLVLVLVLQSATRSTAHCTAYSSIHWGSVEC